ncbi:penicillin-binding protein 2 [soil metagenome]
MRLATPSTADQAESTGLRLTFLALLVVSLFVLLFARLWYLQIMAGERFQAQATGNAVRTVTLDAPRGKILDRDGETIVRNRYAPVVSVMPDEMGDRQAEIYADLADLLAMTPEQIADRAESRQSGPFRPRPIAVDVPPDVISYIHENSSNRYPGVYAETLPLRDYPNGTAATHLLGYLGEISEDELADERYSGYQPGTLIGRTGIEHTYQSALRGTDGERRLEVDAVGNVLRDLGDRAPVAGSDVRLSIDLDAQRLAEEALVEGIETARGVDDVGGEGPGRGGKFEAPAGAVVVLDPNNGQVVAMASYPTFDPESFVGGISQDELDALLDPDAAFPLINRAIQSSYPPGSVFKVVPAATALEEGYMSPGDTLPCPGEWEWNESVYRNWDRSDNGHMDLAQSLVDSCDTVFYELARNMWFDEQRELPAIGEDASPEQLDGLHERMSDMAEAFGMGQRTGIDLTSERGGVVPGRQWKRQFWEDTQSFTCDQADTEPAGYLRDVLTDLCHAGYKWRGGDSVNMSIGQGDVQTTPLQIANAFAAIANRGTLYEPHVAAEVVDPDGAVEPVEPEVIRQLPVSRANLDYIHAALTGVTAPGGTAGSVFGDFPVQIAGKTGTAEYKPKQPIAWFAGYGPAESPQYVVVAMVEEGGGGSQTAAPITKRIFEGLFDLEETEIQPGAATD